jgi:glycogen operon protein
VGGPKDIVWLHPTGREMTDEDWADESLCAVGAFVSGSPLRSPGPHGEQQIDNSFVLWFNAAEAPLEIALPVNDWVQVGEVVLSTDSAHPAGTTVRAGAKLTLGPKTVLVVRSS